MFLIFLDIKCSTYIAYKTHISLEKWKKIVYAQWGYKVHFSNYKSNARGTAILIHNNFEYKVIQEKVDINGKFLILDIIIQGNRISLVTLYGPNKDKPTCFENINLILDELGNEHIIMCGDFNLVLEPEIDTENYQHVNNPNARNKLLEIIENKNLIDAYRQLHETEPRFTWRKLNPRRLRMREGKSGLFSRGKSRSTNLIKQWIRAQFGH